MILRHELLTAMRAAPEILPVLVRGLDDASLRRRPAPGEWAIVEVLGHLGDTEERALGRTRRMLREEAPLLAAYDQAALAEEHRYIELDATRAIERFAALRREHLAELERLEEATWQRVGIHEEEGPISVELHAAHLAAEDANHLAQIARMIPV